MNFANAFTPEKLQEAWNLIQSDFLAATWQTLYVTILSTLFAILIGMPLGMVLVVGDKNGIRPWPPIVIKIINVLINLLRSVPFLILVVVVIPLTRAIVGTAVGDVASIVPLVIAAFPFVARLAESSLREVDGRLIEMARSFGASPGQIIWKVMLRESIPSLLSNATIAITTILSYSAMSGIIGGGGLGKIAIDYGYYRYRYLIMLAAALLLVVLVQLIQSLGSYLARKTDKRSG